MRLIFRLLVILLTVIAVGWSGPSSRPVSGQSDAATRLFVADFSLNDGSASGELRELDPLTLADATISVTPVPVTPGGNFVYREWVGSADGSTAVTIDWPRGETIRRSVTVRRGLTGSVISQFDVPGVLGQSIPLGLPGATFLSADGRRLVLVSEDPAGTPTPAGGVIWWVYDTADGRRIAEFRAAAGSPDAAMEIVALSTIDPTGEYLYRLASAEGGDVPTVHAVHLIVNDLATGAEIGRLDVPDLQLGQQNPDATADDGSAGTVFAPGFAVSPDGRELAIVRPDGAAAMLIDTQRLVIARTVMFPTPLADRSSAGLASPSAGDGPGVRWNATYAADGRTLLVWGTRFARTVTGGSSLIATINLQRIDLTRGQITAAASLDGWTLVWPAADGRSLYLTSFASDDPVTPGLVIRRLNAVTLAIEGERTIPGRVDAVLWPRVPGCQLVTIWF